MGTTLIPVPFWSDQIRIKEVVEASRLADFNIRKLSTLRKRLNYSSLYRVPETGTMRLHMRNGEFIEFVERN